MKKTLSTISLLIALCLITACALDVGPKDPLEPIGPQNSDNEIAYFTDEAELLSFVEEYFVSRNNRDDMLYTDDMATTDTVMPEAPTGSSKSEAVDYPAEDSSEPDDFSETNVQVDGVDEGDILKTDGKYIYIIQNENFIIVDITGDVPQVVSKISLNSDANYSYFREMYIKGDKAIFICDEELRTEIPSEEQLRDYELPEPAVPSADAAAGFEIEPLESYDGVFIEMDFPATDAVAEDVVDPLEPYDEIIKEDLGIYTRYQYSYYTSVYVYDITDRANPVEERKISFEGALVSSREMDGKLYLVNEKNFYYWIDTPAIDDIIPEIYDSENVICTPEPTDIAKCIWETPKSNVVTIAVIDYISDAQPEILHMMGCGSDIFMNSQSLYIFGNSSNKNGYYTDIVKYSITNGIVPIGSAKAPGYASTQFAYDEYNGKFRIATTANIYNGEKYINMNNIYVYDEFMNPCGSLTGLAPDESIKSVRFMGDMAYLVTFKQVDPLFVIDMSENDPKVLGELKIPGFSTYLHPVGENLLLGIGSETIDTDYGNWVATSVSGLKVSLFDVSDPANPIEVDVASYVGGKNAYSVAKDNHNAFVYSSSTNTGYFPLTTYDDYWTSTNTLAEVKIENNQLEVKVAELEAIDYKYSESRVCYSGSYVYLFRNYAITKLDRETLNFICEIDLVNS